MRWDEGDEITFQRQKIEMSPGGATAECLLGPWEVTDDDDDGDKKSGGWGGEEGDPWAYYLFSFWMDRSLILSICASLLQGSTIARFKQRWWFSRRLLAPIQLRSTATTFQNENTRGGGMRRGKKGNFSKSRFSSSSQEKWYIFGGGLRSVFREADLHTNALMPHFNNRGS